MREIESERESQRVRERVRETTSERLRKETTRVGEMASGGERHRVRERESAAPSRERGYETVCGRVGGNK